jgi:hypothetical protein
LRVYTYSELVAEGARHTNVAGRVSSKVVVFIIEGAGPDGKHGTNDDLTAEFTCPLMRGQKVRPHGDKQDLSSVPPDVKEGIAGIIVDEKGAAVPNARVKIDGHEVVSADSRGFYHVSNLPPGFYTVIYEAYGFVRPTVRGVPVKADCVTMLDVVMPPGVLS